MNTTDPMRRSEVRPYNPRMPSTYTIRRLARLSKRVQGDLRRGGMGITFRYLFRSTTILARISTILAEQVAELSDAYDRLARERGVETRPVTSPPGTGGSRRAATRS
jgi:hypothetical protein